MGQQHDGSGVPMTDTLRRFYEITQEIKELEAEKANLRDGLVQRYGTGKQQIGKWLLNIASFTSNRFDRQAAEAELGSLERFEKPNATLRVEVKPAPSAILEATA